ncbi:DivIVA domain-containing protein [Sinomonas mesophila]|uniref:DivIVA domain-containing protein n=1 Tax=Sinomonas mesophila TaxID=1531955 RepID=UPI001FEA9FD6|nr:DivIVA domain-containing protein [Sinomonas mesophila]
MSFFLVFLAMVLAAGLVWFAAGVVRGRRALDGEPADGFDEPPAQLPPVLLPEHPTPDDVDRVRFSLAFRGYRMDQVDQVLETLRDRIGVQAALIEALTAQMRERRAEDAADSPTDA